MNSADENPDSVVPLTFYCRDCESTFDSLPDGTGYEQAPCPNCREVCMTVAFERQEQERNYNEATLFSVLGNVTGLFRMPFPKRPPSDKAPEAVTIVSYEKREDAEQDVEQDVEQLAAEGIKATLAAGSEESIELTVAPGDVRRANEILLVNDSPPLLEIAAVTSGVINFACEECGAEVSLPGTRRGAIETCPHCAEYIDVPEE